VLVRNSKIFAVQQNKMQSILWKIPKFFPAWPDYEKHCVLFSGAAKILRFANNCAVKSDLKRTDLKARRTGKIVVWPVSAPVIGFLRNHFF
jgi:hypothetical protein